MHQFVNFYFRESKRLVNEEFFQKFNILSIEWLETIQRKQLFKIDENNLNDKDFIKMRISEASGGSFLLMFTVECPSLIDEIKRNGDCLQLNEEVSKNVLMTNDLFSFVKEAEEGQGRDNYVFIKMRNNNLTIENAMDCIVAEIIESDRLANLLADKLIFSGNQDLAKYAKGLIYMMNGNAFWSANNKRYKNIELKFFTN